VLPNKKKTQSNNQSIRMIVLRQERKVFCQQSVLFTKKKKVFSLE
jgi:hypothetical protein